MIIETQPIILGVSCSAKNFFVWEDEGASWCKLTDDVTTCPMMTSLCVIELIMLGLV